MTEEQIERRVERQIDALDTRYMAGELTEAQYDAEMRRIDAEASAAYAVIAKARGNGEG